MTTNEARTEGKRQVVVPPEFNVIAVADEILKVAKRQGMSLTPMQLVKLTYIMQGFSLAILGRPLFPERIEAWKYGPVIPTLYQATKTYGRSPIPAELIHADKPSRLDKEIMAFVEDVVSKYAHLSGIRLSSLTHQEGSPWHQVYEPGARNRIEEARIAAYYKELVNVYQGSATA